MPNENQTIVNISFWQKQDGEDECILSVYANIYPNYREGDTIFLEVAVYPAQDHADREALPLTEFSIVKIVHAAKRSFSQNVSMSLSLEVFVEKTA